MTSDTSNIRHHNERLPSLDVVQHKDREYTREETIRDLQELAETFPERRITRDFYRTHANIPEKVWTSFFGTFPEFMRQAGLQYTRIENRVRLRIGQHASVDDLRKISEDRKSYGENYLRRDKKRYQTMVACSDLHDKECDPFYLRVLVETIKNVKPEYICIDGDLFDIPEFGKYTVDPREWDTVGRIQAGLDIVRQLREAAPGAQIDLIEGNHEARLIRHVSESSPAMRAILSDMHDFTVGKLFKLDQYEVNYVAKGDLFAFTDHQLKKETMRNYKVYWNCMIAHHFPEGKKLGLPGFHGHHHQHLSWTFYNNKMGSYEWHQLGAGHVRDASYTEGAKWNNGFMIANCDTHHESMNFDYTYVGDTMSVSGGTFFYREEDEYYPALTRELEARKG